MTSSKMTLRPAAAGDAALVLSFIRQLADYEKIGHLVRADVATIERTVLGPKAHVHAMFICHDGLEVGFVLWFYNFSTLLGLPGIYLDDLYIQPAYRGLGYGKAVMVHLAQRAVAEGCGRFEWTVLDWNAASIKFYRSLGAVGMDEWTVQRVEGTALHNLAQHDES